jgi:hypothetical protein
VLTEPEAEALTDALVDKFKAGTLRSTVEPRQLARIARSVGREEVSIPSAREAARKLVEEPNYTIDDAFSETAEDTDALHSLELQANRLAAALEALSLRGAQPTPALSKTLMWLRQIIDRLSA